MIGFIIGQLVDNFFSQPYIFSNSVKSHPLRFSGYHHRRITVRDYRNDHRGTWIHLHKGDFKGIFIGKQDCKILDQKFIVSL